MPKATPTPTADQSYRRRNLGDHVPAPIAPGADSITVAFRVDPAIVAQADRQRGAETRSAYYRRALAAGLDALERRRSVRPRDGFAELTTGGRRFYLADEVDEALADLEAGS